MKLIIIALVAIFTTAAFAGDTYVNGYTRKDGTYVKGYTRSTANETKRDNYGSKSKNSYGTRDRDSDNDGIYNQYDSDDDNDGTSDNDE